MSVNTPGAPTGSSSTCQHERDAAGDRPGRIGRTDVVGIGDAQCRRGDQLAHGGRVVADGGLAGGIGVEARYQRLAHVVELQPLDVGEAVDAVPADDVVRHRDDIVAENDGVPPSLTMTV